MAVASARSSHLGVTDNQKRWLVVGIALNKVIIPQIRPFVEKEVMNEYNNLKTSHNIDAQTTSGRLQRWPPRKFLKYENINGNDAHPKRPGGRYDYSLFDCRVLSHIDFARLYVENYMAKFNTFDEHCDASAVLLLLGGVPVFSAAVQAAAGDVRMARNDWAHCVFSKWDQAKFQQSFDEMEDLLRAMALPAADEAKILGELNNWETQGTHLCMNSPVDQALLQLVQQEVKSLHDDVENMSVESEEERAKVQQELQNVTISLEEMAQRLERLETGQQNLECRTSEVEERVNAIEERTNEFEEKVRGFTLRQKESASLPQDMSAALPEKLVELIRRNYKGAMLSPFPWCEDELQLELSNIFTRLKIKRKTKERGKQTDDIVNMTGVFRPHAECNEPRVVLIEGDPGMGKTTYCQKLAYDWSVGEIPPEASFPKVEMLLLLKCRDMNTADIRETIDDQLLPQDVDDTEKQAFFYFVCSNQSRILLVLDGLDELRQGLFQGLLPLIQGKVFCNIYVMLTARHEAGMKVRRYCDTLLEIVGYRHDDANNYIENYFSNHDDPSLAQELIEKLEEDEQLRELTANPLNTALLCLLYEETRGAFPSKRTKMYDALVECAIRRYFAKRGAFLDEDDPMERFADQLNQLGKMALEALLENRLYFSAGHELKCQSIDFLELCFLSREPSVSKIRPTPCYAFTHKTFQEYFAACYLAHQVLTGDQGTQSILARLSPVDNWQVWEFLLTMVTSKNSEKGAFVVSRLCAFFYCKRPEHLNTIGDSDADADVDSNDNIREDAPFDWTHYCDAVIWNEDEEVLNNIVTEMLDFIAECECGENELEDYQKKMVHVLARCLPVYKLDLSLSSCFRSVYSEYFKMNCTLRYLHLDGPLSNLLLTTIRSVLHPKNRLRRLLLSDRNSYLSSDSEKLAKHVNLSKTLGAVLESGHLLTHFELIDVCIFDEGVEALTKALQANHVIIHLNLGGAMISDLGAVTLAYFLQSNCTLSHLSLTANWISGVGALALAEGLQFNRTLKRLDLSHNLGGDLVAEALARALESKCALKYLDLSFVSTTKTVPFQDSDDEPVEFIGPPGASALARALRLNDTLTYLKLSHNSISDTGAVAIGEALKSNWTLTHLDLEDNAISEPGGKALGEALQSNCTLTHLNLSGNCIGDPGGKAVAKALQSSGVQLTRLDLSANIISSSGATAIAEALQCNRSLKHLEFSYCNIGSCGAVAVAKALRSNCTLTHLRMRIAHIDESGVKELAQALLYHNNTLMFLDLTHNPIGSLGAKILRQVSEQSSCILHFNHSVNFVNE